MNCCAVFTGSDGVAGKTAIAVRFAAAALLVTFRVAVPCRLPDCAVIVTDPATKPETSPAPLMEATPGLEELHCTELEMLCVLPSLYPPLAVNCCPVPAAMDTEPGVTWIEASCGAGALAEPEIGWFPVFPPQAVRKKKLAMIKINDVVFTLISPVFSARLLVGLSAAY